MQMRGKRNTGAQTRICIAIIFAIAVLFFEVGIFTELVIEGEKKKKSEEKTGYKERKEKTAYKERERGTGK